MPQDREVLRHKIKCVMTFSKDDQTLLEIQTVALYLGLDICQIKLEFVQKWLENVKCSTVTVGRECCAGVYFTHYFATVKLLYR